MQVLNRAIGTRESTHGGLTLVRFVEEREGMCGICEENVANLLSLPSDFPDAEPHTTPNTTHSQDFVAPGMEKGRSALQNAVFFAYGRGRVPIGAGVEMCGR